MEKGKHFVLVHGSCHGVWCWYKLLSLLKLAGHHATALDLGASGINPKQLDEVSSISDYIQPLMDLMASLPQEEKVILVGHSYAGLCISLCYGKLSPKYFGCGFLDSLHVSLFFSTSNPQTRSRTSEESLLDTQVTFQGDVPISAMLGPEYMRTKMYPQSPPEGLELAKMLVRPSGMYAEDFSKDGLLTKAKFGSVSRVFIVCEEDEVMKKDFQWWMIKNYPPDQEVTVIRGAGHMVMVLNPKELCKCLLKVGTIF